MKKFMLDCRFNFVANVKKVRHKVTNYPLKTIEVILDVDGQVLT